MNLLAAAAVCVMIYSPGTNGDAVEKKIHEYAHIEGWVHPVKSDPRGHAYKPLQRYRVLYQKWQAGIVMPPCKLTVKLVSLAEAQLLCGGHFGCAFGGRSHD